MASWRRKRGYVYVFYYDLEKQKQKWLPRSKTKHLDHEPDKVIDEWVARWEQTAGVYKLRPDLLPVPGPWEKTVDEFCDDQNHQGKATSTVRDHRRHIMVALPYFTEKQCQSWADFHLYSRGLGLWLKEKANKTHRRIYAINSRFARV